MDFGLLIFATDYAIAPDLLAREAEAREERRVLPNGNPHLPRARPHLGRRRESSTLRGRHTRRRTPVH